MPKVKSQKSKGSDCASDMLKFSIYTDDIFISKVLNLEVCNTRISMKINKSIERTKERLKFVSK